MDTATTKTASPYRLPVYSPGEVIANVATHAVGVALGAVGLVLLLLAAVEHGGAWRIVSSAVFGATLVLLYGGSALYHGARAPAKRHWGKIIEQCLIYLLIAGTYTPFTLVTLRGPWGWTIFGVVWGLALVGICMEAWWVYRPELLSITVYLLMGWVVIVAIKPLAAALPPGGMAWLVAGGVSYTVGTIFYVIDQKIRYMHAIWHLFVLGGSVCHFVSIYFHVIS